MDLRLINDHCQAQYVILNVVKQKLTVCIMINALKYITSLLRIALILTEKVHFLYLNDYSVNKLVVDQLHSEGKIISDLNSWYFSHKTVPYTHQAVRWSLLDQLSPVASFVCNNGPECVVVPSNSLSSCQTPRHGTTQPLPSLSRMVRC